MVSFSKIKRLSIYGAGSLAISSLLLYNAKSLFYDDRENLEHNNKELPLSKWDHNWDRRDPRSLEKHSDDSKNSKRSKARRHIILVRHGQYNLQGKGDSEKSLTKLGKLQAEMTGLRLADLALPYTTIIRSTMTRAQETSKLIESYLDTVPAKDDPLLIEGTPVQPDPPVGHFKPEKSYFRDGPRIEAAFRKYFHRAEPGEEQTYTIIVCHANVIRYFVCRALQFPPEAWLRLNLNHGSITWLTINPNGRVILRCYGETGHMLPEFITAA